MGRRPSGRLVRALPVARFRRASGRKTPALGDQPFAKRQVEEFGRCRLDDVTVEAGEATSFKVVGLTVAGVGDEVGPRLDPRHDVSRQLQAVDRRWQSQIADHHLGLQLGHGCEAFFGIESQPDRVTLRLEVEMQGQGIVPLVIDHHDPAPGLVDR